MTEVSRRGDVTIRWDGAALTEKVRLEMSKRVKRAAVHVQTKVQRNISKSSRTTGPAPAGGMPRSFTGKLRQSIFFQMQNDLSAIVGTNLKYGLWQEIGATITPKQAKALAVPISKKAKIFAGSPREFPVELHLIPRGRRPPLLVEKQRKKWIIHYVLLQKVRLPARPYLSKTLEQERAAVTAILTAPMPGGGR